MIVDTLNYLPVRFNRQSFFPNVLENNRPQLQPSLDLTQAQRCAKENSGILDIFLFHWKLFCIVLVCASVNSSKVPITITIVLHHKKTKFVFSRMQPLQPLMHTGYQYYISICCVVNCIVIY